MRRRFGFVVFAFASASGWLGCSALLGIETAVFDPDQALEGGGGEPDPLAPDAAEDGPVGIDGSVASEAGPCANTQINPKHCGVCGHDCLGGLCNGGVCLPATVAPDVGGAFSLAIDETHVYWTNRTTQNVKRVPKGGGVVEIVFAAPGAELSDGLAVRDGDVYFGTRGASGAVVRCPVAGCGANAPAVVVPVAASHLDVAAGGLLSLAAEATGDIYRCTLPCAGAPELVASGEGFVLGITATPGQVLWSRIPLALRTKNDGAALVSTLGAGDFISQMVVVGDELVYAQLSAGARVALRDGGAKRSLVASGNRNTDHVAVRDGVVFFNDFGTSLVPGRVLACPMAGCGDGGGVIAGDQDDPRGLAVDDKTIFWANGGAVDAGAIMRLAR